MKIVILLISIVLFGCGIALSFLDKSTGIITSTYAAAVLCLIFVFLQEFKKFKGFGLEAELLENKVKEADLVLNQLRGLLAPISEMLFSVVARQGLWDSRLPKQDSYRLIKELAVQLRNLGQSEASIEVSLKEWHDYNILDLTRVITNKIKDLIHEKFVIAQKEVDAFKQPIDASSKTDFDLAVEKYKHLQVELNRIDAIPALRDRNQSDKEIDSFLKTTKVFNESEIDQIRDSFSEEIQDLNHYIEKHEFRRIHAWFARE